jgi:N-acetylglucosamine-6-sulfatase
MPGAESRTAGRVLTARFRGAARPSGIAEMVLACAIAVALWSGLVGSVLAQQKPNVLVVLADDLDNDLLEEGLRTSILPQIRRVMVDAATTFSQSFVSNPLCCPSRATFLTGQYSHNNGVFGNAPPRGGIESFDDSSTVATWMSAAGYRTAHVGKYLNGYMDYRYVPPGWTTWNATVDWSTYCMYDFRVSENGRSFSRYGSAPADYQTDVLAGYADRVLRRGGSQPFFLTVAPLSPHNETCIGKSEDKPYGTVRAAPRHLGSVDVALPAAARESFNEGDMSDKPEWMRELPLNDEAAQRALFNEKLAALRSLDELVGRLYDTLVELGQASNTVIVFTSDNGYFFGTHRLQQKGKLYEEAIRVPLLIRDAGQTSPRVSQEWVVNNDLAPTIAQYGYATPTLRVDGRSLVELVKGLPVSDWRQSFLIHRPVEGLPAGFTEQPYVGVRTKDRQVTGATIGQPVLVYAQTLDSVTGGLTDVEFYDLRIDPFEIKSLHASTGAKRLRQMSRLKTKLDALLTCGGDNGPACRQVEN